MNEIPGTPPAYAAQEAEDRYRAAASGTSQTLVIMSPVTAPKPTHVIRLEPGVNWSDRSGGH